MSSVAGDKRHRRPRTSASTAPSAGRPEWLAMSEQAVVRSERLAWWVGARPRMVIRLREPETSSRFVRLATAGAVGFSVMLPLIELGRIATYPAPVGPIAPAVVTTACYRFPSQCAALQGGGEGT